jgi:guanine deaminase
MTMGSSNLFLGTFVHTTHLGHLEVLHDHIIVVDDLGFIEDVCVADSLTGASYLARPEATITCLPQGSFLLPTFCDLHLHAPQYLYLGTGLHLPLMEWLNAYAFKAEEQLDQDPQGLARMVYTRLAERLMQAGTGAALLFGTIQEETK